MRSRAFRITILPVLLLLAGCSATDLVNALVPETGFRVVKDLQYGDKTRQKLDL